MTKKTLTITALTAFAIIAGFLWFAQNQKTAEVTQDNNSTTTITPEPPTQVTTVEKKEENAENSNIAINDDSTQDIDTSDWETANVNPFMLKYPSTWQWKNIDLGWLLTKGDVSNEVIESKSLMSGDIGITFYGGPIVEIPDSKTTLSAVDELFKNTITNIKDNSANVTCQQLDINQNRSLFCEYHGQDRVYKMYYLITTEQSAHSIRVYASDMSEQDKVIIEKVVQSFQPKY